MKIILKLKPDEVRAMVALFERIIQHDHCDSRRDAMITIMMLKLYKKLKEKSILIDSPLRMHIPPEYAIAFIEFFEWQTFDRTSFTGNLLMRMMMHFDQQTAGLYSNNPHKSYYHAI